VKRKYLKTTDYYEGEENCLFVVANNLLRLLYCRKKLHDYLESTIITLISITFNCQLTMAYTTTFSIETKASSTRTLETEASFDGSCSTHSASEIFKRATKTNLRRYGISTCSPCLNIIDSVPLCTCDVYNMKSQLTQLRIETKNSIERSWKEEEMIKAICEENLERIVHLRKMLEERRRRKEKALKKLEEFEILVRERPSPSFSVSVPKYSLRVLRNKISKTSLVSKGVNAKKRVQSVDILLKISSRELFIAAMEEAVNESRKLIMERTMLRNPCTLSVTKITLSAP
jgi:hypothetical protein